MRDRDEFAAWKAVLALVVTLLLTQRAPAYIGPGAGLEFIGYFSSMIALVLAAFSTVLLWPVYSMIRWLRGFRSNQAQSDPSGSAIQKVG
jgi:hypothetical protein